MCEVAFVGKCVVWWFAKAAQVLRIGDERVVDSKNASSVVAYAAVVRAAVGGNRARAWRAREGGRAHRRARGPAGRGGGKALQACASADAICSSPLIRHRDGTFEVCYILHRSWSGKKALWWFNGGFEVGSV